MTPEYADRNGWMLDTSSVPWLAYRGPPWAPYATAHVEPPASQWWPGATVITRLTYPLPGVEFKPGTVITLSCE